MRLDDLDPSDNVRDLGSGGGGGFGGGGGILLGLLPLLLGRRMGCGTIALLIIVGVVVLSMFGGGAGTGPVGTTPGAQAPGTTGGGTTGAAACNTAERRFACQVMTSTEQVWGEIFRQNGQTYRPPTLNFYTGGATSGCGFASSAVGPYYCPADQGVFLDTSFFNELANRFGARGDAAQAYVIAHEVGHHIQNLLGTSDQVARRQQGVSRTEGNALSVKLELQADCYAGVWLARIRDRLEPGDIEEGMTAANAVGDDTLQQQSQGSVVPDSFTHGTSAQRQEWLQRGFRSGDPGQCDTFAGGL